MSLSLFCQEIFNAKRQRGCNNSYPSYLKSNLKSILVFVFYYCKFKRKLFKCADFWVQVPNSGVLLVVCACCFLHQKKVLVVETFQDFLIKLDIKPLLQLLEMKTFKLNNVIIRLTKIMNRAEKNWAHFQQIKYFKNQSCQTFSLIKVGLLIKYSSQKFFWKDSTNFRH